MKKLLSMVACVALFGIAGVAVRGQEKPKPDIEKEDHARVFATMKVLFVLTEFEGAKKIAALPYMFLMNAEKEKGFGSPHYSNFIRTGVRLSTSPDKDGKMQFLDIGSNVDCALSSDDAGHYLMRFSFERAALSPRPRNDSKDDPANPAVNYAGMAVPTFRTSAVVPLKEGQATEVMSAADPLNGHTYTLTVTVSASK